MIIIRTRSGRIWSGFIFFVTMTDKDKRLIDKARRIDIIHMDELLEMKKEAESEEARRFIHEQWVYLYHLEEYYAGCP